MSGEVGNRPRAQTSEYVSMPTGELKAQPAKEARSVTVDGRVIAHPTSLASAEHTDHVAQPILEESSDPSLFPHELERAFTPPSDANSGRKNPLALLAEGKVHQAALKFFQNLPGAVLDVARDTWSSASGAAKLAQATYVDLAGSISGSKAAKAPDLKGFIAAINTDTLKYSASDQTKGAKKNVEELLSGIGKFVNRSRNKALLEQHKGVPSFIWPRF